MRSCFDLTFLNLNFTPLYIKKDHLYWDEFPIKKNSCHGNNAVPAEGLPFQAMVPYSEAPSCFV